MPTVVCPRCDKPLTWECLTVEGDTVRPCPTCRTTLVGKGFPALLRPPAGASGGGSAVVQDLQGRCFTHDGMTASVVCDQCGRFLCALCELPIEKRTYCSSCVDKLERDGILSTLRRYETRHDSVAISLAILPLLLWPLTFVTAPLALVYIWKHWSYPPRSILRRTRWRLYVAGVFAGVECAAWAWLMADVLLRATQA